MNLFDALQESGLVHRLGWGLVHSLWLGIAIAMVLALLLRLLRNRSANIRYLICCGAMAALLATTIGAVILVQPPAHVPETSVAVPMSVVPPSSNLAVPLANGVTAPGVAPQISEAVPAVPITPTPESWLLRLNRYVDPSLPWVVLTWAVGVFAMALWQLSGWMGAMRICKLATTPAEARIVQIVTRLARAMRISRPILVLDSLIVKVPTLVGWLRPVILLPVGLATGLSTEQLEAILLHELAHIRRMDYLVNLLQRLVEAILFYHPAVWFISRRIRMERENCCDDVTLAACGDPTVYAEALLAVAGPAAPRLALAATGGQLLPRIRRILGLSNTGSSPSALLSSGLALMLIAAMVVVPIACSVTTTPHANPKPDSSIDVPEFHDINLHVTEKELPALLEKKGLRSISIHSGSPHGLPIQTVYHIYRSDGENLKLTYPDGKIAEIQRMPKDVWYADKLFNGLEKAAEGLQVKLRAKKDTCQSLDDLELLADVRNTGKGDIALFNDGNTCWELEVDGQLYISDAITTAHAFMLAPGEQWTGLDVPEQWMRHGMHWRAYPKDNGQVVTIPGDLGPPLVLTPGKHTIRVSVNPVLDSGSSEVISFPDNPSRMVIPIQIQKNNDKPARAISNAIEINVVAADATQPTEEKLRWGKPVNGLRAALAIRPSSDDATHTPDLYLVVQNVSQAPIHLNDTTPLSDKTIPLTYDADSRKINDFEEPHRRGVFIMLNGRKDEVEHIDNHPTMADVMLQPREVAYVLMFTPDAKSPAGRTSGSTIAADARTDPHETLFAVMKIDEAPAGAWTGKLVTPETTGAVAAGNPAPPATTAPEPANGNDSPWGAAVEGVQVRLRAKGLANWREPLRWKAGETPTLLADVRNQGTRDLQVAHTSKGVEEWEIEIDDLWYHKTAAELGASPIFEAGKEFPGIFFTLDASWQAEQGGNALKLTPGKHTVRVVITAQPTNNAEKTVRSISNAVEIEILPQPKDPKAQALFQQWQANARTDGKIPGALIGNLGDTVKSFISVNKNDSPANHDLAVKFEQLLPRFDATHDWTQSDAIALLDDIAAIHTAPLEATLENATYNTIRSGKPLPAELVDAPWGQPSPDGLRVAWLLEPRAKEYPLGTPLKSRILVHNSGKKTAIFIMPSWQQSAGHTAHDAKGTAINISLTISSEEWTTLAQNVTYRLAPGEYCETQAPGIGVGVGTKNNDRADLLMVGSSIDAKPGDQVRFTPGAVEVRCSPGVIGAHQASDRPFTVDLKDAADLWNKIIAERVERELPLPAATAERAPIIRRVTRDLFGQEPTPEEIAAFAADDAPTAPANLEKRLAARPGIAPFTGTLQPGDIQFGVLPAAPDAAKNPPTPIPNGLAPSMPPPATAPPTTRAAAPTEATASATQTAAATQPAPWGDVVGGLQLRLTPEKAIWKKTAGEPEAHTLDLAKPAEAERFIENNSALNLDIRNTANFALPLNNLGPNFEFVQIEYDGKLYDYFGGIAPKLDPVRPGDTINTSLFPREGDLQWGSYPDFKPGTHTIRMVLAYGDEKIFSNPVMVEIAASQSVATAPAASKGQDAVRATALDKLEKLLKQATPKGWALARTDGKMHPDATDWVGVGEGTEFVMTKVPANGDIMLHLWLMKPEYQGHVRHPVIGTTNVTNWQGGMAIQYGGIDSTSWSGGYHPPEDYPWVPVRKAVTQALAATAVTTVADAAQDLIENTKSPELLANAATTQPASSKALVKDGLQVTVILPKATFAGDEPLKFTVQFKNVSEKLHTFYDADYFWNWAIRFQKIGAEKSGAGGSWLLENTAKDQTRTIVHSQSLKPGETFDVPVDLDKTGDFAFVQDDQQFADLKPIKRLQPGRYQLVVEIKLTGSPDIGRMMVPGVEWTGEITTDPVEFEITDKAAATQAAATQSATAAAPATAPAMTEEQVVAEIENLGGKVTRFGNVPDGLVVAVTFAPIRIGRSVPLTRNEIDAVLEHLNGLTQLKAVDLSFSEVSDAGLEYLQRLNQLQTLNLDNTKVTDAGLKNLKGLSQLQNMDLDDTQVADAGLEQLAGLNQLQELSLNRTNVTDAGLVHLWGLHQLQQLFLGGDKVTDAGVEQLKVLKQLQVLYLTGTKVTDAGLAHLAGLSRLQHLNLIGTDVTDAGLEHLQGLTQLQTLFLSGTKVTDTGLAHLEGLKQLQMLILQKLRVTDAGLAHLAGLNQLRTLDLSGTNITDAGLAHLEGLHQLLWLGLGQSNVTDAGLEHLKVLNQLEWVDLQSTKVTDQGIKQLEDALPKWKLAKHNP